MPYTSLPPPSPGAPYQPVPRTGGIRLQRLSTRIPFRSLRMPAPDRRLFPNFGAVIALEWGASQHSPASLNYRLDSLDGRKKTARWQLQDAKDRFSTVADAASLPLWSWPRKSTRDSVTRRRATLPGLLNTCSPFPKRQVMTPSSCRPEAGTSIQVKLTSDVPAGHQRGLGAALPGGQPGSSPMTFASAQ